MRPAHRVMAGICRALENLVPFPPQGHKRSALTTRPVRFKWVRDYQIAYAPDENSAPSDGRHARPRQPRA